MEDKKIKVNVGKSEVKVSERASGYHWFCNTKWNSGIDYDIMRHVAQQACIHLLEISCIRVECGESTGDVFESMGIEWRKLWSGWIDCRGFLR